MGKNATRERGFTLIELSIVLVGIGLIVGGILVGQELIHAAGLRKTVTELQQFQTAITTFRGKYDCLPGDCANATSFFGADPTCPTGGGGQGTCNGNGDGQINGWAHTAGQNVESHFAWQQLALAHLISGNYIGGYGTVQAGLYPCCGTPANLLPAAAYNQNIGYNLLSAFPGGIYGTPSTLPMGVLTIQIGEANTGTNDFLYGAGFNAVDSLALDTKMDDGLPNTGNLIGENAPYSGTGNTNLTCLSGASYSQLQTTGCVLWVVIKAQ